MIEELIGYILVTLLILSPLLVVFVLPYFLLRYIFIQENAVIDSNNRFLVHYFRSHNWGFVKLKEAIDVNYYTISSPLVYYYNRPGTIPLPFAIYRKCAISEEFEGEKEHVEIGTGYFELSPQMRSNYLSWLMCGRTDQDINQALLFIYLYGLEYRVFKDKKNEQEILFELARLYQHYSSPKPFAEYLEKFITYLLLTVKDLSPQLGTTIREMLEPIVPPSSPIYTSGAYLKLESSPLSELTIARWIGISNNHQNRDIPEKYRYIIDQYIILKGQDVLDELKNKVQVVTLEENYYYTPALQDSYFDKEYLVKSLAPNIPQSKLDSLHRIREQCVKELIPTFRKYGKASSYELLLQLPEELIKWTTPQAVRTIKELDASFNITSISFFTVNNELPLDIESGSHSYEGSQAFCAYFEKLGLAFEPDARIVKRGFLSGEYLAYYKTKGWNSALNKEYMGAAKLHDLAHFIIREREIGDESNFFEVAEMIQSNFCHSNETKERFHCKDFLYSDFVRIEKNKEAANLGSEERQIAGKLFFMVALLEDSHIEDKVEPLKELFNEFAIEENLLNNLIEDYKAAPAEERDALNLKKLKTFTREDPRFIVILKKTLLVLPRPRQTGEIVE